MKYYELKIYLIDGSGLTSGSLEVEKSS